MLPDKWQLNILSESMIWGRGTKCLEQKLVDIISFKIVNVLPWSLMCTKLIGRNCDASLSLHAYEGNPTQYMPADVNRGDALITSTAKQHADPTHMVPATLVLCSFSQIFCINWILNVKRLAYFPLISYKPTCTVKLCEVVFGKTLRQDISTLLRWEDYWERKLSFVLIHGGQTLKIKHHKSLWLAKFQVRAYCISIQTFLI